MLIISHRGNLNGRNPETENHPDQIIRAVDEGFDVEVDVWFKDDMWYFGHDEPTYEMAQSYFNNWKNKAINKLWIHAKNLEAVEKLSLSGMNWFWHENDKVTLTSKGYVWCFSGYETDGGIMVDSGQKTDKKIFGVCTDNPRRWQK